MLLTAERVMIDGVVRAGVGVRLDAAGRITEVGEVAGMGTPDQQLDGRLLVPGLVNAHSHAFQRLLRGRTQIAGPAGDTFWTWRDIMYRAAAALDPEAVFVASRQMFLELALAGVAAVGEFHYLHHQVDGTPYAEPTALSDAVIRAAQDVGLRICVLRTVYLRGDFDTPAEALQRRFCDPSVDVAAHRIAQLAASVAAAQDPRVTWGVAAHSVRAVPSDAIGALKTRFAHVPFHLHVSEQRLEVEGCRRAYGLRPVELLSDLGVLDGLTTLVHATHVQSAEVELIARSGATVCVCPSTEADLGDGLVPAAELQREGVPFCVGTDGQTLSSVLEEARRLEMHERLRTERRNVLAETVGESSAVPLWEAATRGGARSLGIEAGAIEVGCWGDFCSIDLGDPALCGWDDDSLPAAVIFSAGDRAVCDLMVGGQWVVKDGWHPRLDESAEAFARLSDRIFG